MNVGVDFGTTNSSIAFQRAPQLQPECAAVDRHANLPFDAVLRTAVILDQFGQIVEPNGVGAAAIDPANWGTPQSGSRRVLQHLKPYLSTFSLREVWPVKRSRAGEYDYLRQEPVEVPYDEMVESGDLSCSREELLTGAAAVFKRLFESTPEGIMARDPDVVIGIPLTFPDYAKKRLLEITVRSGICRASERYREAIRRVRFLPEPVGAALLYARECEPPRGRTRGKVLMFDSGGGTLDLALMEFAITESGYRPVRQTSLKSKMIAGRRYDECIIRRGLAQFVDKLRKSNSNRPNGDQVTQWQLEQAAESIKVNLSTRDEWTELSLMQAGIRLSVSRHQFEEWSQEPLNETELLVRETIPDLDDVDTVVMVGGSSLLPCVQKRMQQIFRRAQVIHEDPHQTKRGEGVERALTAVSKGLALYDEAVASQGITPFAYKFWDDLGNQSLLAAEKWTLHSAKRPTVRIPALKGASAVTLTLVQELVYPERVLNVLNVPVTNRADDDPAVWARIQTSDGSLYPAIELVDPTSEHSIGELTVDALPEVTLRSFIEGDDHVVRWSVGQDGQDTPYPEIAKLKVGDRVEWVGKDGRQRRGEIFAIHKIANGLPYQEVEHWDITRWRFYVKEDQYTTTTLVPTRSTDIRLYRGSSKHRRKRTTATRS